MKVKLKNWFPFVVGSKKNKVIYLIILIFLHNHGKWIKLLGIKLIYFNIKNINKTFF